MWGKKMLLMGAFKCKQSWNVQQHLSGVKCVKCHRKTVQIMCFFSTVQG